MAQKDARHCITFRISRELAEKIEAAGETLSRMAGESPPSINQYARAFMVLGYKAYIKELGAKAAAADEGK